MASSPSLSGGDKKQPWWLTNKKVVEKYVREAKMLISTQEQSEIAAAFGLLTAALEVAPRAEAALELKARCLLYLRRYREVGDMLQDYIPSLISDDSSSSGSSENSSGQLLRTRARVLSYGGESLDCVEPAFKCFSVLDLKRRVMAGLCKNVEKERHWRYSVLGQACCHLGLMEDAMVLLQAGKRLSTAASRRESTSLSDDTFSSPKTESEKISHLLSHIKLLLRRKSAALAALHAGLHSESIRHFSKIVDSRRAAPQGFLAECYVHRATAYKFSGRIADAIADCNRALALETSCIEALIIRADLFETIKCLPDSLHDLEHLKLLYNSILRDRKLPGPVWKRQNVHYREIPGKLCSLSSKIQELKKRVAKGETGCSKKVDFYKLFGLKKGCSRSELDRAHLLLMLKHKPDKSLSFVEKCEFADDDVNSVRERGKLSSLLLYRLIQKGYGVVLAAVLDEEAAEKRRKLAAAALEAVAIEVQQARESADEENCNKTQCKKPITTANVSSFQGVFCRDLTVVGNLLSQSGYNRPIPVKYEALSC